MDLAGNARRPANQPAGDGRRLDSQTEQSDTPDRPPAGRVAWTPALCGQTATWVWTPDLVGDPDRRVTSV